MTEASIENWESKEATDAQRKKLFAVLNENGIEKDIFENTVQKEISILTRGEISKCISILEKSEDKIGDLRKWALTLDEEPPKQTKPDDSNKEIATKTESTPAPVKTPMTVGKASTQTELMAQLNGIPPQLANMFFMTMDGSLYVKQPGLLHMASKKGYARIETRSELDKDTGEWKAETKIYPVIPKEVIISLANLDKEMQKMILNDYYGPTIGQGRASKANVKMSTMHLFLKEMAETRSVNRALRLYVGYGATSYEEMPTAQIAERVD